MFSCAGAARFTYNWAIAAERDNYANGGEFIGDRVLRKTLTQLKKTEYQWLYELSNNVTKQAVKDATKAFQNFFDHKAQFPRFKSKRKSRPSFYNDSFKKYSNPRFTHDGRYWYISVSVEYEQVQTPLTDVSLGVDLGVKELAICSSSIRYANVNKTGRFKRLEKRRVRLQRKVSKNFKKGTRKTNNQKKRERKLLNVSRKLTNARLDNLHKVTTSIVKTKPYRIVIEDLNVAGMLKNHKLARAIQQQSFSTFRRFIEYKSLNAGIAVVIADKWFPSSKTCSCCGSVKNALSLSERVYHCDNCGFETDRDLNAAINLSRYVA
jgi:putative transposase